MRTRSTLEMNRIVSSIIQFIQNQNEPGFSLLKKGFASFSLVLLFLTSARPVHAQYCNGNVPTFNVNLTGNPNGSWISPNVARFDNCCGTNPPDNCVQFIIILDPQSQGISFNIYSGAMPTGAMFYQINCGPPTPVGQPVCLQGIGPHYLTFCKPGNNVNQYIITSLGPVQVSSNIVLNNGCSGILTVSGFTESTITWQSVYPGSPGQYNSYLSCTAGCDTTTATAQSGAPAYVDYRVCGTPVGGCSPPKCDTVRVYFNPTLSGPIIPTNPTVCFGSSGTWITCNSTGGSTPYTYNWSTGATTQSIFVNAGTYTVTLSDVSGCPPTTASVTVTAFSNPITANAGNDMTACKQNPSMQLNGQVTGASGGIWLNGTGTFNPGNTTLNAIYTPSAAELNAGIVTLKLKTTGNGTCPPDSDYVSIQYFNFDANVSPVSNSVSCNGGSNGTATASLSGGTPPFTYSWNTSPVQTNQTATGLTAGTYVVTIANGYGCTASFSVTITQPQTLSSGISASQNVSCNGGSNGSATITASGGTSPYSYAWSNAQTNAMATGLVSGTYSVTVTDSKGCTSTASLTITQPAVLSSSAVASTNVSCFGASNGAAASTASGGTTPYNFSWNTSPPQNTQTATGLSAGNYVVTITDGNGCTSTAGVTITQPTALSSSVLTVNGVSCYGGNNGYLVASASGGTPQYSYAWNTTPVQNTQTATGLTAGTYVVTVTDGNGCTATASATLTQPSQLVASAASGSSVSCNGGSNGSAAASVNGGISPYTYSWSTSPIQVTQTATGLSAGNYTVMITDNNNCTATASVNVTQPAPLTLSSAGFAATCNGQCNGQGVVIPSGGTSGYNYQWLPSGGNNPSAQNLCAGNYTITVTDANGCTNSAQVIITQPTPVVVSASSNVTICSGNNTALTANASGGSGPYTYTWSNGYTGQSQTVSPTATTTYTVVATDFQGCTGSPASVTVNVLSLSLANLTMLSTSPYCSGGSTQVGVTVSGNTGNVTYAWSPNIGTGPGPYTVNPTATTIYTVTVTNSCGTSVSAATQVLVYPLPAVSLSPLSGSGCDKVTLTFANNGSNSGCTYYWTFGDGGYSNLPNPVHNYTQGGVFTVTLLVTSQYGCSASASTSVSAAVSPSADAAFVPDPYVTSIVDPQVKFINSSQNAIAYLWDFGDNSSSNQINPVHSYTAEGTYVVKLYTTGAGGCNDTAVRTIKVEPEFTFYIPNAFTPDGNGLNEIFTGKGDNINSFSMLIFDRWGEVIYKTEDLNKGWDGKAKGGEEIAQEGVYVYRIDLVDFKNKRHQYTGHVTLLK